MKAMATKTRDAIASLSIVDIPKPEPGPGEIRVKIVCAALNAADIKLVEGHFAARFLHSTKTPLVPGYDFSGVVDRVGPDVSDLSEGDQVWGHQQYDRKTVHGSLAEYTVIDAKAVAKKPDGLLHETAAAAATVGLTALQGLRDSLGFSGGRVLVLGASGGVGALAVGVAKRLGGEVTGVCSTYAVEAVKELGAEAVIDRRRESLPENAAFDAIYDTPAKYSYHALARLLTPNGGYVTTLPTKSILLDKLLAALSKRKAELVMVRAKRDDLDLLGRWLADGMPVPIAKRFAVKESRDALEALKGGGLIGKIVIDVDGGWA